MANQGSYVIDGVSISLTYPLFSQQIANQVLLPNKLIDLSLLYLITKSGFEWSLEERRTTFFKVLSFHKRNSSNLRNSIGNIYSICLLCLLNVNLHLIQANFIEFRLL